MVVELKLRSTIISGRLSLLVIKKAIICVQTERKGNIEYKKNECDDKFILQAKVFISLNIWNAFTWALQPMPIFYC